jgi:DNA-binding NarL/FixJ family response regulator
MERIHILLAEDHKIVREGTRQLLERTATLQVIGEAEDGQQAVEMTSQLKPDLVIMDVHMPNCNGLEATRQIKAALPETKVLILSAYEDDHYIFPLLEAGANGYLLKTSSGGDLVRAIETVMKGEVALDPHITSKVINAMTHKKALSEAVIEQPTERELEVLQAVATGKSNKAIALQLNISTYTVQVHLRNIFTKFGVNSRTEAVTFALSQGWISLNESR